MVIGAGNVGGTLGTAWAQKAGHEIFFGVRNPTFDQTQAAVRRLDGKARRHAGTSSGIRSIHRADDAMECGRSSNPIDGTAPGYAWRWCCAATGASVGVARFL